MSGLVADGQFSGQLLGSVESNGLRLSETAYRPGLHVPAHAHENSFFCQVLQGGFIERSSARAVRCEPGMLLYHPMHESHSHHFFGRTSRCFIVQLDRAWLERLREYGLLPGSSPQLVGRTKATWLATQLYQEFRLGGDASALAIEGYVLAMLSELTRVPHGGNRGIRRGWLRRAREIAEANFLQPIHLLDLATAVGVHPVHLSRAFRRELGCTLTEYVRRLRIDYACRRLIGSTDALSSIALDAGFCDQGHFSRRFKEVTGMTPGAFRQAKGRPDT